jgi:hypothetical protein
LLPDLNYQVMEGGNISRELPWIKKPASDALVKEHRGEKNTPAAIRTSIEDYYAGTCHVPHTWKVTTRETCLACHDDKKEHHAPTFCGDCHQFTEG